jgi:transcriptional regulator with XRE-family HTH domain
VSNWAAVAQLVNKRMQERGITQRELAERSGVSVATLRKIQHGTDQARNRSTLANLSRALGWPEQHLWQVATNDSGDEGTAMDDVWREITELRRRVDAIETRLT